MQQQTRSEEPAVDPALREHVASLGSRHEYVRRAAEARMEALGDRETDELLALIHAEAAKRRKQARVGRWVAGGYASIVLTLVAAYVIHGAWTGQWRGQGDFFSQFASFAGVFGAFGATAISGAQKNATKRLANLTADVRCVPAFADALSSNDKDLRNVATEQLKVLLPRLRASNAGLLDAERRMALCRTLAGKDHALKMAVLQALAQVGDERALSYVRKTAGGQGDEELRAQVAATAAAIEARAAQQRAAERLLRPAEAGDGEGAVLLRPAGAGTAGAEVLLRPSTNDGSEMNA